MKSNVAAAALVLLLCAFPSLATRAGEAFATRWLREHPAAEVDELAELKSKNPGAYAIVKALLTKRSLGLLNPKHPSASFQAAPAQSEDTAAASGPAAFQALASQGSHPTAVYAEAAQSQHDWLHWKPADSAADDEAMVKSVLGAVAELKGGRSHSKGEGEDDTKESTQESVSEEATPARLQPAAKSSDGSAPPQSSSSDLSSSKQTSVDVDSSSVKQQVDAPAAEKAPAAAASENPYLRGLDFGVSTPATARPANHENSYLKSVDLGTPTAKPHVQVDDSTDYLASFSWDDKPHPKAAPAPKHEVKSAQTAERPAAQKHNNALLAWLGGGKTQDSAEHAKEPESPRPATPAEHQNAYMAYLQ